MVIENQGERKMIVSVINGHTKLANGSEGPRISSYENAVEVAAHLTATTGKFHIGIDYGEWVSPRFNVIEFSIKAGDLVSMGFNGDYYPEGKVAKVSADKRIVTLENGKRFFRRRLSAAWVHDKTWSLVPGTRDERNPSF